MPSSDNIKPNELALKLAREKFPKRSEKSLISVARAIQHGIEYQMMIGAATRTLHEERITKVSIADLLRWQQGLADLLCWCQGFTAIATILNRNDREGQINTPMGIDESRELNIFLGNELERTKKFPLD